jgi:hypothetical protein
MILQRNSKLCAGQTVFKLGAGGGSLIAVKYGAQKVCAYFDQALEYRKLNVSFPDY